MDSVHKICAVIFLYVNLTCLILVWGDHGYNYVNLPESHLPYYFNRFPKVIEQCLSNSSCIYHELLTSPDYNRKLCWGYEPHCQLEYAFSRPECGENKPAWIKTFDEYIKSFYYQADFGNTSIEFLINLNSNTENYRFFTHLFYSFAFIGYIRSQINELMVLCSPLFPTDSMLECSKNFRFCHGRNIMINFTELASKKQPWRYEMDVLKPGHIGGYCQLNKPLFDEQMDHMSPLQSWAPELRNFVELNERPIDEQKCDLIYDKPVYIMKIDASTYD